MQANGIIHEVIDAVTEASNRDDARRKLMALLFTKRQADAILDMRISQLTKLDATKLKSELKELQARIRDLIKLNSQKKLRTELALQEAEAIGVRHGNARRSKLVRIKAEPKLAEPSRAAKVASGVRQRFVQVDESKGIVTQLKKLQRGCTVADPSEKLLFICDDAKFYKVSSTFKGPLSDGPVGVLARARTGALSEAPIVVVFKLKDDVRANVFKWEQLLSCTRKGKRYLPEGAELIHIGGTYELKRKGRRRDQTVTINSVQPKRVGGTGTKLDKIDNCELG